MSNAPEDLAEHDAAAKAGRTMRTPAAPNRFLHGRAVELAELEGALDAAWDGQGRTLFISGEAGIGKTALVEALIAAARRGGCFVLAGTCVELTTRPPFGVWRELFSAFASAAATDQARVAVPLTQNAPAAVGAKGVLTAQVLTFLTELAEQRPTLLVIEDAHWADQESVALLREVARHAPKPALLLAVTYRPDESAVRSNLGALLPTLVREARAARIDLRALDRDAVEALMADHYLLPADDALRLAGWLFALGEGNPFFTMELLWSLEQAGTLRLEDGLWRVGELYARVTPELVRQSVAARLAQLSDADARFLEIAAVVGAGASLNLLRELTERTEAQLTDTVENVWPLGLVEEAPGRPGLRFKHVLYRNALYDRLPLPRRRAWHRRVAEALARDADADADFIAHHFVQAGDTRGGRWLIQSGEQAIRNFAYESAALRFEQALGLLGETGLTPGERGWLLCDLALSFRFADASRAHAYLDRAYAELERAPDAALEVFAHWCRTEVRALAGEYSLAGLERAITSYLDLPPEVREERLRQRPRNPLGLGTFAHYYGRHGHCAEALRLGELQRLEHRDEASLDACLASFGLALAYAGLGDLNAARQSFAQARAIATRLGLANQVGSLLNAELNEVLVPFDADKPGARRRLANEAAAAWARVQMPGRAQTAGGSRPPLTMSVFATLLLDGAWDTAEDQALGDLEFDGMRFDALRLLCELALRRGQYQAARDHLSSALPLGPATRPGNFYFNSTLLLQRSAVRLTLEHAEIDEARAWADAHDRWLEWSGRRVGQAHGLLLWARIQAAEGEQERAVASVAEARRLAGRPHQPLALWEAELLTGQLAHAAGDAERALTHLDTALRLARACHAPYEQAAAQLARAAALAACGRAAEAAVAIEETRATAAVLRITPFLSSLEHIDAQIEQAQRDWDMRLKLSARELEVLQLVAAGLTDAEAGRRLGISQHTVSKHLRSVYGKLGVGSRGAATALARRHGVVTPERLDDQDIL